MKIPTGEEERLTLLVRILATAFVACLLASWRLWSAGRLYPPVPLLDLVPPFPARLDGVVPAVLVGLLATVAVWPRAKPPVAVAVVLLATLFAQDQSRLWPSFYEFFLLLVLVLSWRPRGGEPEAARVLAGMRFVLAAVYFWSGVQKLTPHFFHEQFPWFIRPLTDLLPFAVPGVPVLAAAAAIVEVLIGAGLLTRRFRGVALGEALVMHAVILVCIGPARDDWNAGAWLWNLATAALAWGAFSAAAPFSVRTMFARPLRRCWPQAAAVVLVGVAPVLNGFNRWDSAVSFNVYTGNVTAAVIVMPADLAARLPAELTAHVTRQGAAAVLDVNAWSLHEFGGGAYPEARVFRAVFRRVCGLVPDASLRLVLVEKAGWFIPKSKRLLACDDP